MFQAEREAQIEEERAEQGPSARALEEAELASQLAPLGLAIREIQVINPKAKPKI